MADSHREQCECGAWVNADDFAKLGECLNCSWGSGPPIASFQDGDNMQSQGQADRQYHGGRWSSGEW